VVNVVDEPLAMQMVQTSGEWPEDVDEITLTGLRTLPAERVAPPRIADSPVNLECRLHRELELGNTVFVVGEILCAHVREEVTVDGRVDPAKLRPIGRLGGDGYCYVREIFHMPRPKVAQPDPSAGGGS